VDLHLYLRAVDHFNRGEFFDAHEAWEDIWRESSGPEKKFLQGLIQIAVALHHHSTGNLIGAQSLAERGCRNLEGCPEVFGGVRLTPMLESMSRWQAALAEGKSVPPSPKIQG
jgi:uncharacterized protein